jgi:predicted transcriptional regulator of viral defense system
MAALGRTVEEELARIAGAGHGVVTRTQLLNAGVTRHEIATRLRTGSLIRVHRGVYRVGHRAPSTEARYLAAVLAAGDGALLSGRAAAHLLGLIKGEAPPPEVITRTQRRIEGVRTHRSRIPLNARDATTYRGIPITTVPRTLVDVAKHLSAEELARACHEAGVRYGTTPKEVEAVLARRPNNPGAKKLRQVIHGDVKVTLSKLEALFLALLRDAGLPLPETNRPAGGRRVDCRWPEHQLTVELDGYRFHNSRHSWEQDRHREREARARGDDFRRYTWSDVAENPTQMLRELVSAMPPLPPPRSRSGTVSGEARRAAHA